MQEYEVGLVLERLVLAGDRRFHEQQQPAAAATETAATATALGFILI